jgi:hypothetical protein
MSHRALFTVAALAGLSLASGLATAGETSARPLTIKAGGQGLSPVEGTFTMVGSNAAEADSGAIRFALPLGKYGTTADRLTYQTARWTATLKGKRGTLVIRCTARLYGVVKEDDTVVVGSWSIVKGTGRYAAFKGGGGLVGIHGSAANVTEITFSHRYEGTVTS